MAPISRLELRASRKQCTEMRNFLFNSIKQRRESFNLDFFSSPKICKEILLSKQNFMIKENNEYLNIFQYIIDFHAEQTKIPEESIELANEEESLRGLKAQRNLLSHECSLWMLCVCFICGGSIIENNIWDSPNLNQRMNRKNIYCQLNSLLSKWTEEIKFSVNQLQNMRFSSKKMPTQNLNLKNNINEIEKNLIAPTDKRKRILQNFLNVSKDIRNHLNTVETALLLFESDTANLLNQYEDEDEDNNINEDVLLDQFQNVRKQLLRINEKWEIGNQHLVNFFSLLTDKEPIMMPADNEKKETLGTFYFMASLDKLLINFH